jgi:ATP-binding cassette subfamily B protein
MVAEPRWESAIFRRLMLQARSYWGHIAGIFLIDLLAAPIALLVPVPLKVAVDSVIGSEPLPWPISAVVPQTAGGVAILPLFAAMVVLIAFFSHAQGLSSWLLRAYTGERLVLEFRSRLLRHAQRLSLAYHDTKGVTDTIYRIQYDAPAVQWVAIDGLPPLVTALFTFLGMLFVTARIDWQLAVVALLVSPLLYVLGRIYQRRLRAQWRDVKRLESSALSVVQEVLGSLRVVKAFGQEGREHDRFVRHSREGVLARIRVAWAEGGLNLLVGLTIATGTAAVIFFGVEHVRSGVLTLGELLIVMSYLGQLYEPLKSIGNQIAALQGSLISAERTLALLDQSPDVAERLHCQPLRKAAGAIEFRNVSFAYGEGTPVLHNISFAVPSGSRVGILGHTGAGKSTLVSLMPRFYDVSEGAILLDGIDLRDYKIADLRDQFSIVLQEPVLFSTSIAENIAYARPGASLEEIQAAAKAANAHDFIMRLAEGYQTSVGERGFRLSGGERQRVSLARAFLKDSAILILDEPTSAVDLHTEAAILDAMERLMRGRTTFVIAHRLGTLRHCDQLLAIDKGQLLLVTSNFSEAVASAGTSLAKGLVKDARLANAQE